MLEMIRFYLTPLRRNEEGASAVEYGLLVALIAAVIVAAVIVLGGLVNGAFEDTSCGISSGSGSC